ncbi:MAG: hypothetical protein WAO76_00500 [Georgfuchsia sp.]
MITLSSKENGETVSISADFGAVIGAGETISSATLDVTVLRGTDANVATMASGSATIDGDTVARLIGDGVTGVGYMVTAIATTDAGQVLKLTGVLPVRVQT